MPDHGLFLTRPSPQPRRHPDSDIFLDDFTVSRRHAEFRVKENGDVQIVDVGSLNGTYDESRRLDLTS
jgi:pSer/pThr/pTyr-binding forkhead associated (FHA) protein